MKFAITLGAIALVAASAASAQEAFITQVGDENIAVNIGTRTGPQGNTQVIAQQGDRLQAANLANGRRNIAFTFQEASGPLAPDAPAQSLIVQTGNAAEGINAFGNDNIAITVQRGPSDGGTQVAQTIQAGSGNIAVNWQDERRPNLIGSIAAADVLAAPTLALGTLSFATPSAPLTTGFPFGNGLSIQQ